MESRTSSSQSSGKSATAGDPRAGLSAGDRPAGARGGQTAAGSRRWLWYAILSAAYLAAAAPLAYLARDAINPDGVAYVQTARHWAAGRVDLAVNGWFSPMLSWLLVPAVWAGVEPFAVARALGVLYGLLLAAGVVRLARAVGGGRFAVWAYGAALLLSLRTVFAEVTPDYLMAAGLAWYFALTAEMIAAPSTRKAVVVGVLGAACYLTKAYALPVMAAHLPLTALCAWLVARSGAKDPATRSEKTGAGAVVRRVREATTSNGAASSRTTPAESKPAWKAVIPPAVALVIALALCAPWVAAISAKFGRFTTNTSASLSSRSWPAGVPLSGPYPHYMLQRPHEGRIAVWENPAEAKGTWPTWASRQGIGWTWDNQWEAISYNLKWTFVGGERGQPPEYVPGYLGRADLFLTLVIAWGAALGLGVFAFRAGAPQRLLWIWGGLSAGIYLGGYVLLYFYERFTWGAWGMLIALAASVLTRLAAGPQPPKAGEKKPKSAPPPAPSSSGAKIAWALAALVLLSVGYRLVERARAEATEPGSESRMGQWIHAAASEFLDKGRGELVVSNDWHKGLYSCYWTGSVYLGQIPLPYSEADAAIWSRDPGRPLKPFAPVRALIFERPPRKPEAVTLSDFLSHAPGFSLGREVDYPAADFRAVELRFADANRSSGVAPGRPQESR